ncbi:MAG: uroporphyrinogen decarboxylase family protein [candidate division WOR-3 bacterium]
MTARERFNNLFGPTPAPIVFPMVAADHAARRAGRRIRAVVSDAEALAAVLMQARELYDYDLVMVFADTMIEAEALGCRVCLPEDDNAFLVEPLGHLPWAVADPTTAGRMPVVVEATRLISHSLGSKVPVLASLKGPFSLACLILGPEEFLVCLRADPEACHAALQFACANQQRFAEALIAAGGIPFIGDPLASGDILSRQDFARFALPYLRELIAQLHVQTNLVGLHVCGDTSTVIGLLTETGADFLSLDEIELSNVRRALGDGAVLMGNVATQLIVQGSVRDVWAAAHDVLAAVAPRLILSSACDIPRDAPEENVRALCAALRDHARGTRGAAPGTPARPVRDEPP